MNIKAYTLAQVHSQITNGSINNFSCLPQLCEFDLQNHYLPKQGDCLSVGLEDPISCVDALISDRIVENGMQKSIPEWEQCMPDHVAYLENQLLTDAASEESMNKAVLPCQLKNIFQREICDANASQQVPCFPASTFSPIYMTNPNPALGMFPGFQDSSPQCPTFDYFMTARIGCNTLRTDNACGWDFFEGSLRDDYNMGTTVDPCEGNNELLPPPPESVIQVASEMVSYPEQISSNQYWNSDNGRCNSLQYISDRPSDNYIQQHQHHGQCNRNYTGNHNVCYVDYPPLWDENLELPYSNLQNSQQGPQSIPDASDILHDLISNPPRSTTEDILQSQMLMPRCQEFPQWNHQPYMQLDKPSEAQTQYYLVEEEKCWNETAGQENQGSRKPNRLKRAFCNRDLNDTSSDSTRDVLPPSKCLKMEKPDSFENGACHAVDPTINQPCAPEQLSHLMQRHETPVGDSSFAMEVDTELLTPIQDPTRTSITWNDATDTAQRLDFNSTPILAEESIVGCRHREIERTSISEIRDVVAEKCHSEEPLDSHKGEEIQVRIMSDQANPETKGDSIAPAADNELAMKSEEPNLPVVSFTDFFTAEQIKEHISSLRQWNNQSIMKEASENTIAHSVGESSCQMCAMGKLVFSPAPKYCSACGARIKPSLSYYHGLDEIGTQHCFCPSCFRDSRGGSISLQGVSISKANLYKACNNEEDEESWVQCNKCERWQHQICGLYNKKQDLEGKAEYICPKCHLEEIQIGQRMPLSKTAAFGAKNLQKTRLSDHIEQRLFRRLKQEREERAKALGKNFDEVPEAADLVVRVVLSVKKQLKVKQQFLDIFRDENYPAEFPYRSKKIQGTDVCLFGMYVQEFGSECCPPNQRYVYISYLDSVKYFSPEIETVNGEALRTFVYHEILIGYLEYCKKRGFATCYIWACPPLKGEDYILYCHPETQRTPKADKLRRWYKSMLQKAAKENIAVDITNLYDQFFISTGESRTKITAARLPYFDGDYWSTAAENVIKSIEEESGVDLQRKVKKLMTKRNLKAMGHTNPSGDAVKDILLMHKLGQTILPMKEDFIMVYLQYTCTCCHEVILTGSRWICNQCKKFQLCGRCHDVEQNVNEDGTHTSQSREKHLLSQVVVNDVPADTEDKDISLDNDFFGNRHTFLNFCRENHYQFDTLRHAKHSSLMILYHLQNLTAPRSGTNCSICHKNIMVNQGWHCETCPDFDVCDACYQTKSGASHIHKLTRRSTAANFELNSKQAQRPQVKLNELVDILPHAYQCRATKSNPCSYPTCLQIKKLLYHAHQCKLRSTGVCKPCQATKAILSRHSRNCRDSNCRIHCCKDFKSRVEKLSLQSKTQ